MRSELLSLALLLACAALVSSATYAKGREAALAQHSANSTAPQSSAAQLSKPEHAANSDHLHKIPKTAKTIPRPQRTNTHVRSNVKTNAKNAAPAHASASNGLGPRGNASPNGINAPRNSRAGQSAAAVHPNPSSALVARHRTPNPPTIGGPAKSTRTNSGVLNGTLVGRKR
jgi:hypothetical protein